MARHRSPQGRRTHLGLPLPSLGAAAGAGGHALGPTASTLVPRVVATVLAGGALAAAGQAALAHGLPRIQDGTDVVQTSARGLLGAPTPTGAALLATLPRVAGSSPVATAAPDPRPVDPIAVAGLAKAVDRHAAVPPATVVPQAGVAAPSSVPAPAYRAAVPAPRAPARPRVPDVLSRAGGRDAPPAAGPIAPPTAGDVQMIVGQVTSGFGLRWGRPHRGLDVAAPIGTPIHAPLAGEVVASGPASGFGLWVRVRHDDGTITTYGHVNRTLVRAGEHVATGQEIAEVGNRGDSTGPHLHVEVQTPAGDTVNPRPWLDAHRIGY